MRNALIAAVAGCVVLSASLASASPRPKPAAPVKFKASGSLIIGHPGNIADGNNLTRRLFVEECSVPPSQGTDGYVIELPDRVAAVNSDFELTGASGGDLHDLDVDFFNDSCISWGSMRTSERQESGTMSAGTKYVLVTAFAGAHVDFEFTATSAKP